ncbi:MAG TPA: PKD domain-containing protein [Methanospirillum sp.]|nr:PKD domain-containing protein [Methanospirillum sp.]
MDNSPIRIRYRILLALFLLAICGTHAAAIVAQVNIEPLQGTSPLSVYFSDASVGTPVEWVWDFGDGFTGEGPQVMHIYMDPGNYTLTMTVTDQSGASDRIELPNAITVFENPFFQNSPLMPPITLSMMADYKVSIASGPAPLTVQFTDLSTGDPANWSWSFGDGTVDTTQNPTHVYEKPGSYSVSLTIHKDTSVSTKELKGFITVSPNAQSGSLQSIAKQSDSEMVPPPLYTDPGSSDNPSIPDSKNSGIDSESQAMFFETGTTNQSPTDLNDSIDALQISIQPSRVLAGTWFSTQVTGLPGEDVYLWITSNKTNSSDTLLLPMIRKGQTQIVMDEPSGPYTVGDYTPAQGDGTQTIREMIPSDQKVSGTALYGMLRLNQTGASTLLWDTTDVTPGYYSIHSEAKERREKNRDSVAAVVVTQKG